MLRVLEKRYKGQYYNVIHKILEPEPKKKSRFTVRFQCPHCLGIVAIEDEEAGQAVACGQCTRVVVVPATRVSPGSVIGDFVLDKKLGQGGVGVVYLAQQLSLDRKAALKILNPEFSQDTSYVADFIREARAAAHLNYPAIVQAYAVGEEDGLYYFAMEYVEGTSLKQVLAHSGRIVVERSLQIAKEINGALEFAWINQKLVHRDIKPDNIILTDNGRIKLADLGLARRASDILEEASDEVQGTPQYIPPEALLQKPLDNRSDIYSLGATLYHTVTGRFPFLADTPADIARKHLTERLTPPKSVVPDLPDNVAKLIEVMMAKRPEHRYANSTELAKDIALVLQGRMPEHPLHMDSQKPIALDGAPHPSADAKAGRNKKLSITRRPGATVPPSSASSSSAPSSSAPRPSMRTGPSAGSSSSAPAAAPRPQQAPKKKMSAKKLMLLFFSISLGGLAALGGVIAWKWHENSKPAEQKFSEEMAKKLPGLFSKYCLLQRDVKSWDPQQPDPKVAEAVLEYRKFFETACGAKPDPERKMLDKVRLMSDFAVEETLSAWRLGRYEAQKKEWRNQLALEAQQEKAAQELQAKLAEEARIKAAADEKRAAAEAAVAARQQAFEEQKATLRREAAELGRQGNFGDAAQKFVLMAGSTEFPAIAGWAKAKRAMYEKAAECRDQLLASNGRLKSAKFSIPGMTGKWSVASISPNEITFEGKSYNKDGEEEVRSQAIPLATVQPLLFVELAKRVFGRVADDAQHQFMLACYILARGDADTLTLQTAAAYLGAATTIPEAADLQAEIENLKPILRELQFGELRKEVLLQSEKGKKAAARALAVRLKALFPDLYAGVETEIEDSLKSN